MPLLSVNFTAVDKISPTLRAIASQTNKTKSAIESLKKSMGSLSEGMKKASTETDSAAKKLQNLENMAKGVAGAFNDIPKSITTEFKSVSQAVEETTGDLKTETQAVNEAALSFDDLTRRINTFGYVMRVSADGIMNTNINLNFLKTTLGVAKSGFSAFTTAVKASLVGFSELTKLSLSLVSSLAKAGAGVVSFGNRLNGVSTVLSKVKDTVTSTVGQFLNLGRNTATAGGQLNTFTNIAGNATSRFKELTSSITTFIKVGLGMKVLNGVINALTSSVGKAIDRLDTFESFNRKMKLITGSADEATKALDRMNEATVGTPYGLDVAATALQNFVTRGMSTDAAAQSVETWMDVVSAYGKGTNEELNTVTDAIAKMRTKGTVEMKQLNRLFSVGVNPVQTYAKVVGMAASDVQEALSDKRIKADEFLDVVEKAYREGTNGVVQVAGSARNAATTWAATIANMRAALARGSMEIIKSLGSLIGIFNGQGENGLKYLFKQFGAEGEKVLKKIASMISGLVAGVSELKTYFDRANGALQEFKENLTKDVNERLVDTKKLFDETFGGIKKNYSKSFSKALMEISANIIYLNAQAKLLYNQLQVALINILEPVIVFFNTYGKDIINTFLQIGYTLQDAFGTIAIKAIEKFGDTLNNLNSRYEEFKNVLAVIRGYINDVAIGVTNYFGSIFTTISNVVDLISSMDLTPFLYNFREGGIFLKEFLTTLGKLYEITVPPVFRAIAEIFSYIARQTTNFNHALNNSNIFAYLINIATNLSRFFTSIFDSFSRIAETHIGDPFSVAVAGIEKFLSYINALAESLANNQVLIEGIGNALSLVGDIITSIFGGAIRYVGAFGEILAEALNFDVNGDGISTVSRMLQGLLGIVNQFWATATNITRSVLPALIYSASKAFGFIYQLVQNVITALSNHKEILDIIGQIMSNLIGIASDLFGGLLDIASIDMGNPFEGLLDGALFVLTKINDVLVALLRSVSGIIDRFKSAFTTAFTIIGKTLSNVYKTFFVPFIQGVAELAESFARNLLPVLAGVISNMIVLATTVGSVVIGFFKNLASIVLPPVLNALKAVFEWIGKHKEFVISALTGILTSIMAFVAVKKIIVIVQTLIDLFYGFQAAMTIFQATIGAGVSVASFVNPIGLAIVLLGAFVAALVYCYNNLDWFREMCDTAISLIGASYTELKDSFKGTMSDIVYTFAWAVSNLNNYEAGWDQFWEEMHDSMWGWLESMIDKWNWFVETPVGKFLMNAITHGAPSLFGFAKDVTGTNDYKIPIPTRKSIDEYRKNKENTEGFTSPAREKAKNSGTTSLYDYVTGRNKKPDLTPEYNLNLQDYLDEINGVMESIYTDTPLQLPEVADVYSGLGDVGFEYDDYLADAADSIDSSSDIINNALNGIGDTAEDTANRVNDAADSASSSGDLAGATLDKLKEKFADLSQFYNIVGGYFDEYFPERTILENGTMADLENFSDFLGGQIDAFEAAAEAKKEAEKSLNSAASTANDVITSAADSATENTSEDLISAYNDAKSMINSNGEELATELATSISGAFTDGFTRALPEIQSTVDSGVNEIMNTAVSGAINIATEVSAVLDDITLNTTQHLNDLSTIVNNNVSLICENTIAKVRDLTSNILNEFNTLSVEMANVGFRMMDNLANAINARAQVVYDAISNLKSALGSVFFGGTDSEDKGYGLGDFAKDALMTASPFALPYWASKGLNALTGGNDKLSDDKNYLKMSGSGTSKSLEDNRQINVNPTYVVGSDSQAKTANDDLEKRLHKLLQEGIRLSAI